MTGTKSRPSRPESATWPWSTPITWGCCSTPTIPPNRKPVKQSRVFFPNQQDRGSHVNISGAGVTVSSKNRDQAIRLLEFLVSEPSQETFANTHYEYPVRPGVAIAPLLESWGQFKADSAPLARLGELNRDAVELFDQAGWR